MKRELTLTDMDGHIAFQTCYVCGGSINNPNYHEMLGMCWCVKADLCSHCAMIQAGEIPGDSVTHCANSNPIYP